jgi:DNA repair protein RecN (Recombination protein N)
MLCELYIENIALIRKASVRFDTGLNVLTGETGAGKTILISAIQAVLGERTSRDLIRTGEKKALVSALFRDISPRAVMALTELGYAPDEEGNLLIQREITLSGNNCRIGGMPATVAALKQVGACLLAIHGQFDTQALTDIESHRGFIDSYGGLSDKVNAYTELYDQLTAVRTKLSDTRMSESQKAQRLDFLSFQINEIDAADLTPGEDEVLMARRDVIHNSGKIADALMTAVDLLGGNETIGAADAALAAADQLARIADFLPDGESLIQRLNSAGYELRDIVDTLRDSAGDTEYDPGELDAIEGRLDILYRLTRKYDGSVADIIERREAMQTELDDILLSDQHIKKLEAEEARLADLAEAAAARLTEARREAGERFAREVERELLDLDMPAVRLDVSIQPRSLGPTGADSLEILFSANRGEAPRPLSRIASGGEMSRFMLAVKNVLSGQDDMDTLIFDEIDTGVSGRAAHKIGGKLKSASKSRQILCVTHLAQVAAFADYHLLIEKQTDQNATFTEVVALDDEGRARELARITGGETLTPAALQNAREMLKEAQTTRA